jgi:hypothetical protein
MCYFFKLGEMNWKKIVKKYLKTLPPGRCRFALPVLRLELALIEIDPSQSVLHALSWVGPPGTGTAGGAINQRRAAFEGRLRNLNTGEVVATFADRNCRMLVPWIWPAWAGMDLPKASWIDGRSSLCKSPTPNPARWWRIPPRLLLGLSSRRREMVKFCRKGPTKARRSMYPVTTFWLKDGAENITNVVDGMNIPSGLAINKNRLSYKTINS